MYGDLVADFWVGEWVAEVLNLFKTSGNCGGCMRMCGGCRESVGECRANAGRLSASASEMPKFSYSQRIRE